MIARPVLIAALLASASAAVPARAQDKQDRKDAPFTLQQALGDPDGLTISGSVRGRYEVLGNQFRPGPERNDVLFVLRTTLLAEYDPGPTRNVGRPSRRE